MSATPATLFGTEMTTLTNNAGGNVQSLLPSLLVHGKERRFVSNLPLAAQASGSVIGMARLPLPFTLLGVTMLTDTSLGSSTVKLGNAGNGNSAIYKAAATFTATNTPTGYGLIGTWGVPIYSGFDCVTGLATGYTTGGNGGALYEDVILTVGAADLPASGNLRIIFGYMIE